MSEPDTDNPIAPVKRCYGNSIIADYQHNFGEPYLAGRGYTAKTVLNSILAEGSADHAAKVLGIPKRDVMKVWDYAMSLIFKDGVSDQSRAYWDGLLAPRPFKRKAKRKGRKP